MTAIEKPHTIEAVFWDGTNQEEVEKVFPMVRWVKYQVGEDAPVELQVLFDGSRVMSVSRNMYLCWDILEANTDLKGYFCLTKEEFEKHYTIVD
jgi:hypothetical protein